MFSKEQIEVLNLQLDSSRIKVREKGNISLSYIEGFDVIDTANLIFGYGNWSYLISKLEQVSQEQNHNQNYVVCYKAIVQVLIHSQNHSQDVSREDVGFGTGVAKTLADAHENAAKEAVTDAIKRAMRSFGNQFGNSLYDKSRNHQNSPQMQNSNYQQNQNTNENFNKPQNQQHYQNQTPNQNVNNSQTQGKSFDQYEYSSLYNLGLNIVEKNGFLVIAGENQYAYRDAIKACSFKFDPKTKTWWKEQGAA